MKRPLLLIFMAFACHALFAQRANVHFIRADIYKGLSNNQVTAIHRDRQGFAWIGTSSGLNRYDGYVFRIFRNDPADSTSINDNFVDRIFPYPGGRMLVRTHSDYNIYDPVTEKFDRQYALNQRLLGLPDTLAERVIADSRGNFWFIYANRGLWKYHPGTIPRNYHNRPGAAVQLPQATITDVCEATDGNLWIIYSNGLLQKLDWRNNRLVYSTPVLQQEIPASGGNLVLYQSANGDCWVYSEDEAMGAYRISFGKARPVLQHYSKASAAYPLNADIVSGISEDRQGNTWIATDHGGINLVDAGTGGVTYLVNNSEDQRSISQNAITALYRDNEGIIWVGTYKQGLNYFNQEMARFPLYKHLANTPSSLPYEDVNRFAEDAKGNLWIGTNGGGLVYFDRAANRFQRWMAGPGSISNNVIVSLCIDSEGKLWIGTYFGGLDVYDGKTFKHFRHDPADTNSIADDKVWEIFEDSKKRLWIGTLTAGLDRFDRNNNRFIHYKAGEPNSVQSSYISAIIEDKKGRTWFGTGAGVDILEEGRFTHFQHKKGSANTLSNNTIIDILETTSGLMWIGTREGLSIYDPVSRSFKNFTKKDGLPDNTILKILQAKDNEYWISTPNGLSQVHTELPGRDISKLKLAITNYDESNNLQGREFNENAALKTTAGELIFGGPFGFNLFHPADINPSTQQAAILLTGFDVFNKPVQVGEKFGRRVLLNQSISLADKITLGYSQNLFSISFAAIDFSHAERDRYAYTLGGFNNKWFITDGSQRRATFTNLNPGNYTFRVKTVNTDGSLGRQEASVQIRILPPFWLTPWAYAIYVLLVIAALWLARRILLQRARMRFDLEQERQEARRMHELDLMKIRFITNVSHEFRTPLSLILTPADKLVKNTADGSQKKQLQLIHRNARRLLNLVNQLLDFRKMEVQEFRYEPKEGEIVAFIREISYSFTDIAEKKHIHFSFHAQVDSLVMAFDPDKMEKILFNLLSNAYKFTPDGGEVSVSIDMKEPPLGSLENNPVLLVNVSDTGIGIPEASREKIFERFFQNEIPGNILNQGSGIGLAIVKEFVRLHNGIITVESEPDHGSCFTIQLPVNTPLMPNAPASPASIPVRTTTVEQQTPGLKGKRATVLIVEDNEDFRFYLKENLGLHFKVAEAANGKEGWQRVQDQKPDLVVSDIMMPVMNGLELAKKIKHDPRIAATPVILLTARTAEEQQLEGLDTGVNDYITKPFSFEILLSRIRNLLQEQRANKKPAVQITVNATDAIVESADEKLVQQALRLVEEHMANPEFSVEYLSRELLISRVGLYKKLVALTGKTPLEFIKEIRMKRAKQLLRESSFTVAEIAYEVGFNDPKYFSKAFKKEFGVLPSAYGPGQTGAAGA